MNTLLESTYRRIDVMRNVIEAAKNGKYEFLLHFHSTWQALLLQSFALGLTEYTDSESARHFFVHPLAIKSDVVTEVNPDLLSDIQCVEINGQLADFCRHNPDGFFVVNIFIIERFLDYLAEDYLVKLPKE